MKDEAIARTGTVTIKKEANRDRHWDLVHAKEVSKRLDSTLQGTARIVEVVDNGAGTGRFNIEVPT